MDLQKVSSPSLKNFAKKFPLLKNFTIIILTSIILILFLSTKLFTRQSYRDSSAPLDTKGALVTQSINREFSFPLKDSKGDEIGSIKYLVEKAELRDEIIVKGNRATAIPGRAFVVFTVKITNDFKQAVQVNTRNYIRLSVNGNTRELIAPDIHNDPVEVQAISTKSTRVGFSINTSDTDISLWVGDINADKEQISITL